MKKRKFLLSICLVFLTFILKAQDLNFATKLPLVYINTGGNVIPDNPRIEAKMEIAWKQSLEENSTSDPHNHFKGNIKIEIRGSSSHAFNNQNGGQTYYQYEYPGALDIQPQQKEYIKNYINEFESAVYNEDFHPETGYSNFINPQSFFDYIIMNEIAKNVDGYRLSTFLYKDKNEKLNAGPLWDFNLGYGNANYFNGWKTSGLQLYANLLDDYWQNPFWWKSMMNDEYFTHPLRYRWNSLRENKLSNQRIFEVTDSLVNLISDASVRNFNRWQILDTWVWPNYFVGDTYWKEINWMKDWIDDRLQWLD